MTTTTISSFPDYLPQSKAIFQFSNWIIDLAYALTFSVPIMSFFFSKHISLSGRGVRKCEMCD